LLRLPDLNLPSIDVIQVRDVLHVLLRYFPNYADVALDLASAGPMNSDFIAKPDFYFD